MSTGLIVVFTLHYSHYEGGNEQNELFNQIDLYVVILMLRYVLQNLKVATNKTPTLH